MLALLPKDHARRSVCTHRGMINRVQHVCCALAVVFLLVFAGPARGHAATADSTAEDIAAMAQELSLRAVELQSVPLGTIGAPQQVFDIELSGVRQRVFLEQHSLRAPGFRLLVSATRGARDGGARGGVRGGLIEVEPELPRTYRGSIAGAPGSVVAAAIGSDRRWTMTIRFADGETWFVQPAPGFAGAMHAVYRPADIEAPPASCGVIAPAQGVIPALAGSSGSCSQTCLIAFDADYEYYLANGSSVPATLSDIEQILNSVQGIFFDEVNVSFSLTQVIVRTEEPDPYTTTDHVALLNQFRNDWEANHGFVARATAHLMTGKDLDGNVIGVAWVGVVCTEPAYSYGLSQANFTSNGALRSALVAHELGHNFNASHCNGDADCGIMCSGIGGCAADLIHFGAVPRSTIIAWCNSVNCLGAGTPPPPPPTPSPDADPPTICAGGNSVLSATSGDYTIEWFTGPGCSGAPLAIGPSINVSPPVTTTYSARATTSCASSECASVTVVVNTAPVTRLVPQDYATIQLAIDASCDADTILVSSGTYSSGSPVIDFKGKNIIVKSASGPASTTINGGPGSAIVELNQGETSDARLEGFTLTGSSRGIEITGSSPTIFNCWINGSFVTDGPGAGVHITNGAPHFQSCKINGNTTATSFNPFGAGVYVNAGAPVFESCEIIGNSAISTGGPVATGGGVYVNAGAVSLTGCRVSENSAQVSSGIHVAGGSLTIQSSILCGNTPDNGSGWTDLGNNCFAPSCLDANGNGMPDACENADGDGDGVPDNADNCPAVANPDQANFDSDIEGDACDADDDNDGLSDADELTAGTNPFDPDTDDDGLLDGSDPFPLSPIGDLNGDGAVDVNDLLMLIGAWGTCPVPPASCPADICPLPVGDGVVDVNDLLCQIGNWG